jgi:hypothetical protein
MCMTMKQIALNPYAVPISQGYIYGIDSVCSI